MNDITHTDAILFPADGRTPHLVPLMSSTVTSTNPTTGRTTSRRVPHPQVHMNYIATNTPYQVWDSRVITNISYARNFQYPYVVFFPVVSQNGGQFPTNLTVRDIQGRNFRDSSEYTTSFHVQPLTSPKIPGGVTSLWPSTGMSLLA